MKETVRNFVAGKFPALWQYRALFSSKTSYLNETGWRESLRRGRPCRPDGSELPWMNYSIITFLEKRLSKEHILFEYGSGYSTIFYSRLVKQVTSVEYNEEWFTKIKEMVPGNVEILFIAADEDGDYCQAIESIDHADVVIVDGRDRINCLRQAIGKLSASGVIVLDDSSRERYAEATRIATDAGFRSLDFEGLKPTGFEVHRSTLYYRRDNCLGL